MLAIFAISPLFNNDFAWFFLEISISYTPILSLHPLDSHVNCFRLN